MSRESARRRPRRIAADEAHAWARNLRLNNHHGKDVLKSLTLYVDGDGFCFVGIEQLAFDCELSPDTVRRRLVWLEDIGAITRQSQWLDASGVRNGEGRGKRTSDLIRLLIDDGNVEHIEARARGESVANYSAETTAFSPSSQRGLNPAPESVSPAPALCQPSQSCEGLISEPEPESSPLPSSRGSVPDDWKEFESDWQEPILRQSLAIQEWSALSPADRQAARRAARGYVVWRGKQRKPPNVIGAHLFLRERSAWAGFAAFVPEAGVAVDPEGVWIAEDSDSFRVLEFLHRLARVPAPYVRTNSDGSRGYYRKGKSAVGADALAMLEFVDHSDLRWDLIPHGTPQFAAWQRRFVEWVGKPLAMKIGESGIRVPCPWPPKRDGTIYRGDAAPSDESAHSDDAIGDVAQHDQHGETRS